MPNTATTREQTLTAATTPDVERLLSKFAAWLDKPWKTATQIDTGNLLNALRIHARFMHGCRALENEAETLRLLRDYGTDWKQLHAAFQYADDAAALAWDEAMADAARAFTALTGISADATSPARSIPTAELLDTARRFTAVTAA